MGHSRRIDYTQYTDFMRDQDYSSDALRIGDYIKVIHDPCAPRKVIPLSQWKKLLHKLGLIRIYPEHTDYRGYCGWIVGKGYYPGVNEAIIVFEDNQTRELQGFHVTDLERMK